MEITTKFDTENISEINDMSYGKMCVLVKYTS